MSAALLRSLARLGAGLLGAALCAPSVRADEALLGTFPLDPVRLVRDGLEVAGQGPAVRHGACDYLFESEATRAAFAADPERYGVRLGGACARMGALSRLGRPELHVVHDGGLYVFASEACRNTFLRDPSRVLEPQEDTLDDPGDAASRAAAEALIARAVKWLGGAERLDGATVSFSRVRTVTRDGEDLLAFDTRVFLPGRWRVESVFLRGSPHDGGSSGEGSWRVLTPEDAFALESSAPDVPQEGRADASIQVRDLVPSQRRALRRERDRELLALLQTRHAPHFVATMTDVPRNDGLATVEVLSHDVRHVLTIDPVSGRVHSHACLTWGPGLFLQDIERVFLRWQPVEGLMVPVAWERWVGLQRLNPVDRVVDGYQVEVTGGGWEGARELWDGFQRPR